SQEVPVSTPFLKAPVMGAALDVPVPARFAVPAAAPAALPVDDIAADVARVAVATDAGVAARPPVGEVGQVAHDVPGPARSDGAVANVADRGVTLPASLPAVPVADASGPIKAGDAAPAFQVFASALHRDAALREDRRAPVDALAAPGLVAPVTTVAPAMAAQDAPLDMRQDQWPQGMIDRIEALRDQADANDTRIRLVPDALGTIDIAISRRDDQVHVRFEAEQAQTRAMLAQAQPELTALASARGLKLGEAGVDPGQQQAAGQNSGQNGAFTQQQQQPRTMRNRTASAAPADSVADDTADAMRIA
uniref:flagellar hook-length control protein FliK n=1 Tax=uncultured Sphingomonas sp. TaxID=158754 RepID=UPI00261C292F